MSQSFCATVFVSDEEELETEIIKQDDFDSVVDRLKSELRNKEILGFFISNLEVEDSTPLNEEEASG